MGQRGSEFGDPDVMAPALATMILIQHRSICKEHGYDQFDLSKIRIKYREEDTITDGIPIVRVMKAYMTPPVGQVGQGKKSSRSSKKSKTKAPGKAGKVFVGPRGGRYTIVSGRKVYVQA